MITYKHSNETKKKISISNRGKKHKKYIKTLTHRNNLSKSLTGRKFTKEHKINLSKARRNRIISEETKLKTSFAVKKIWSNLEYRDKTIKSILKGLDIKPNRPEKILLSLLDNIKPGLWKYVGNGEVIINGRNPDFINEKENKIIELFGDYWHSEKVTGKSEEEHCLERKKIFDKYDVLIIWEKEVTKGDKNLLVKKKIGRAHV